MKKILLATLMLLLSFGVSFAQKRKDAKKLKLKSCTENTTKIVDGKTILYKEAVLKFDANGNTVEETRFSTNGTQKKKTVTKYNAENDIIEEKHFEGLVLNEIIEISYNAAKDKAIETTFDGSGKIIRKVSYAYDKNGLRTTRIVTNAQGQVTETKKYSYE